MPPNSLPAGSPASRGRLGGLSTAARHNPAEYTQAAQQAARDRFLVKVDPEGTLPKAERLRRATAARRLFFAEAAYKSAIARRKRAKSQPISTGSTTPIEAGVTA